MLRQHIQKCTYWTDCALRMSPTLYYTTVAWKRAVHFAKLAGKEGKDCLDKLTPFERKIVERGYPIFNHTYLFKNEECGSDRVAEFGNGSGDGSGGGPELEDPIESMAKKYETEKSEHEKEIQSLNDRVTKLQQELALDNKNHTTKVMNLTKQLENLVEDYDLLQRKYNRVLNQSKRDMKLYKQEIEQKEQELEHFRESSKTCISIMNDSQKEYIKQVLKI